jgi:HlyD family secretion protein
MSPNSAPDVIDVIPVLKPDKGSAAAAPVGELVRALAQRLRWPLLGLLVLAVVLWLAWRTTRAQPFVLVGQVEAQEINVLAPTAGLLTRLHVQSGQRVEAGGALFEIDAGNGSSPPTGSTSLLRSQGGWPAAVLDLRHIIRVASDGVSPAQASELAQARAELDRQRLEATRFERSAELAYGAYQRSIGLYEDSMIDAAARDAALAQWKTADAQVRTARNRLEEARRRVASLLADLPAQAAVTPLRAPAQTGAQAPAANQAMPAAHGLASPGATGRASVGAATGRAGASPGGGNATSNAQSDNPASGPPALSTAPAAAGAATSGATPPAAAPLVAEGAGAPARNPVLVGRLVLRAPVAGEVDRIAAQPGSHVAQGQWLMSLLNLSDVWVVAVVREDHLPAYAYNSVHKAEVSTLAAQAEFRVEALTQLPDFATWRNAGGAELRSFEVRLRATAALPGLRPGMQVVFAQQP